MASESWQVVAVMDWAKRIEVIARHITAMPSAKASSARARRVDRMLGGHEEDLSRALVPLPGTQSYNSWMTTLKTARRRGSDSSIVPSTREKDILTEWFSTFVPRPVKLVFPEGFTLTSSAYRRIAVIANHLTHASYYVETC